MRMEIFNKHVLSFAGFKKLVIITITYKKVLSKSLTTVWFKWTHRLPDNAYRVGMLTATYERIDSNYRKASHLNYTLL